MVKCKALRDRFGHRSIFDLKGCSKITNAMDMEKSTSMTILKWKVSIKMGWYNTIKIADYCLDSGIIKISNGFVNLKKYDYFIHKLNVVSI